MHRALQELPVLGQRLYPMFESLVFYDMHKSPEPLCEPVETMAKIIIDEIRAQGLSDIESDFAGSRASHSSKNLKRRPALPRCNV